jgi:hypothetical protein
LYPTELALTWVAFVTPATGIGREPIWSPGTTSPLPSEPASSRPQQRTVPSLMSAQKWYIPEASCVTQGTLVHTTGSSEAS